jgi:hypothetical protein
MVENKSLEETINIMARSRNFQARLNVALGASECDDALY